MTISVLIPAYNAEKTLATTLDAVLRQTVKPDEILVMDDGSTDTTASIAESFRPYVKLFSQPNKGLGPSRNILIEKAQSELIAFLDSDDIWHPAYIDTQLRLFAKYPSAVVTFTGHITFYGDSSPEWPESSSTTFGETELLEPVDFLHLYATTPGNFLPSFCCVPRRILESMGPEPFKGRIAEDVLFCNQIALKGPIAFCAAMTGAYRVRDDSLSSDRLRLNKAEVDAYEILNEIHRNGSNGKVSRVIQRSLAVKKRLYAKALMGAGKKADARVQLRSSLRDQSEVSALAKSIGLLVSTYMPAPLQPKWPTIVRMGTRPALR